MKEGVELSSTEEVELTREVAELVTGDDGFFDELRRLTATDFELGKKLHKIFIAFWAKMAADPIGTGPILWEVLGVLTNDDSELSERLLYGFVDFLNKTFDVMEKWENTKNGEDGEGAESAQASLESNPDVDLETDARDAPITMRSALDIADAVGHLPDNELRKVLRAARAEIEKRGINDSRRRSRARVRA